MRAIRRIAAGALVLAGASLLIPANGHARERPPAPVREVVSFGDSLSDAGTYGFRFTTMPGLGFAQIVSRHYGPIQAPNEHVASYADVYQGKPGLPGPGGLNYAEGGARANHAYSAKSDDAEGTPISTAVQLKHFLAQHGVFAPDQVVTLYIGTNDAALNYDPAINPEAARQLRENKPLSDAAMQAETARVEQAARDEAQTAHDILAHGATRLVVFTLPDLGRLPWFRSPAARAYATRLGRVYNRQLLARLPHDPRHLLVIDTAAFFDRILKHPARYGFRHGANEDACRLDDQDSCSADAWKEPHADRTFVFAAAEHMTTRTNMLLARHAIGLIDRAFNLHRGRTRT